MMRVPFAAIGIAALFFLPTVLAAPEDYAGSGTFCFQNALITSVPALVTNCRVTYTGRVTLGSCDASRCSYHTAGSVTMRTDVPAFLEVDTSVTTDRDGAAFTCRGASDAPVTELTCSGETNSIATVGAGECNELWADGGGSVVVAASPALPPGFLGIQGVGSITLFAKICRDASGAPSLEAA